jgi:hypothetical protein
MKLFNSPFGVGSAQYHQVKRYMLVIANPKGEAIWNIRCIRIASLRSQ